MIKMVDSFSMADWNTMHAFIAECYRKDHILCHKEFFEWQFRANAQGDTTIISAWDDGQLIGILGYLPFKIFWGQMDNPQEGVWGLYWMVRKQGPQGLGWLMMKRFQKMSSLLLTVNSSDMGGPFIQKLGWTRYSRVPRHIFVMDRARSSHMLSPGATQGDLEGFFLKLPVPVPSIERAAVLNQGNYNPDWTLYSHLKFGTVRSLEYLKWRFMDHPVFDYQIILQGPAHRPCVCIFRIEKAFGSYESNVGRIVDFYFPNDLKGIKEGQELFGAVLNSLKEAGCVYADFICSNKLCNEAARAWGGSEESEGRQVLPSRLAPIQHLLRHQNIAFVDLKNKIRPECSDLYVTKSDIDGDGPAGIPEKILR